MATLALDIDGVLNIDTGTEQAAVHIPEDDIPESPYAHRPVGGLNLTICWDPEVIAWVNEIADTHRVVWATTWEHAANLHFAPTVGLRTFDVIEHSQAKARLSEDVASWKMRTLRTELSDQPTLWIDDSAWAYADATRWDDNPGSAPFKVIVPNRRTGPTREQLDIAAAFLNEHI